MIKLCGFKNRKLISTQARLFGWFSGKKSQKPIDSYEKCHVVFNFTSCDLGKSLVNSLSKSSNNACVIAVAQNAHEYQESYKDTNVHCFEADMLINEDRSRFVNWMHESKYGVETVFHNYPKILKVEGEKRSLDHFKSIMGVIIEQPLFINSDLLNSKLMHPGSSILHSLVKQKGIYTVLYGSFIHMERCLEKLLIEQDVSAYQVNPGIYSKEHIDNLQLNKEELEEANKEKLCPEKVSQILSQLIINHREQITGNVDIYKEVAADKWKDLIGTNPPKEPKFYTFIR